MKKQRNLDRWPRFGIKHAVAPTAWARIYMSGPIEVAKQVIRENVLRAGLCVTIEPTLFIYTGGEETGFVVGLLNYPRFPSTQQDLAERARTLLFDILAATFQHSGLLVLPETTEWVTKRSSLQRSPLERPDKCEGPLGENPCASCRKLRKLK